MPKKARLFVGMNMETITDSIVIIDDVPVEACILEDMLKDAGYCNTKKYFDPLTALNDISEKCSPSILITDYYMPEMSGTDVIEKVFNNKNNMNAIIITGDSEKARQLSSKYTVFKKNINFHSELIAYIDKLLKNS
jgi:DNA-binding NtrC family response regulator